MENIFLITCTKRKLPTKAKAKDIYISPMFVLSRQLAEKRGCLWFIVSARFGLLKPDCIIEPYDKALWSYTYIEQQNWALKIAADLIMTVKVNSTVAILGDDTYALLLQSPIKEQGFRVEVPLLDMSLKLRYEWLTNALNDKFF